MARWRRRRGAVGGVDAGAALAEAAIVTPVVVAAVVALVVTSVLWRDHLAASGAAAAGARMAGLHASAVPLVESGALPQPAAGTPLVVSAVARALGGVSTDAIERVVVFGADLGAAGADADPVTLVPDSCRFGEGPAPSDACVVLGRDAVAMPSSVSGCGPGACPWRDRPGVDVVGVLVRVQPPELLGGLVPAPSIEGVALAPLERGRRA